MTMTLAKHHGSGNDFLVLLDLAGTQPITAALARALCDRHRGVGADGLIRGTVPASGPARLGFELRNADGGEAEMSGNGMRCLVHAAYDAGLWPAGEERAVATPAGLRHVTLQPAERPGTVWASVTMGRARVAAERSGVPGERQLEIDMGNPHLVILGPDPSTVDVDAAGPAIERMFPEGINVEWVGAGGDADEVAMRVWERGVGPTQACGTGSAAVAVAMHHWGRAGRRLRVRQPGGDVLAVAIDDDGEVRVAGPSQRVASVLVELEDVAP